MEITVAAHNDTYLWIHAAKKQEKNEETTNGLTPTSSSSNFVPNFRFAQLSPKEKDGAANLY